MDVSPFVFAASILTQIVLCVSILAKIAHFEAYRNWVNALLNSNRWAAINLVLPIEFIVLCLVSTATLGGNGVFAVIGTSVLGLLVALAFRLKHKEPCACFGNLSLTGQINTTTVFLSLTLGNASLVLLSYVMPVSVTIGVHITSLVPVLGFAVASQAVAIMSATRVSTSVEQVMRTATIEPTALISAIQGHIHGDSRAPIALLFTTESCQLCTMALEPFNRFAGAFSDSAHYIHVNENNTSIGEKQHAVIWLWHDSLHKVADVRLYPSLVLLPNGKESRQMTVFEGVYGMRKALALLVR